MYPSVHCSTLYNRWHTLSVLQQTNGKEDVVYIYIYIYIYSGILDNHEKERNDAICSSMDGPREYHTK